MPHSFRIKSAKGGQFVASYVYNAETIFWSETYAAKDGARNAIASLKKNVAEAGVVDLTRGETGKGYRFELASARDGQTFVRFVASNGETMVRTETYKSKSSARNAIESLRKRAADTPVVDEA